MTHYWPVYYKGFSFGFETEGLILARNLSLTGEYKLDNSKNVILSSEKIVTDGIPSKIGNKLTPILYSKIFNILGFKQQIALWVSLVIYGLISVLSFLLVYKTFNVWAAGIFVFIDIFSPLISQYSIRAGSYEWSVLFICVGLIFLLWKEKIGYLRLFVSGLMFALASLSRNSVIILPIAILIYEFLRTKSFKRIAVFILPLLILWGIYLGPGIIKTGSINNTYLGSEETDTSYMHIFPDQYTWFFDRGAYIDNVENTGNYNYDYSQFLGKYGYAVSTKNKILMYWASIVSYPKGFLSQTTIGGPFMVFLLILGGIYLYKNKKDLLKMFFSMIILTYIFLIVMKSNHWGHFVVLEFPLFLMASLGIYWIGKFILKQNLKNNLKYFLIIGLFLALLGHLIQSDKWVFHEGYLYSNSEQVFGIINSINQNNTAINRKNDIFASGQCACSTINYYTDVSCVCFDPITIDKLLKEQKLQWAFNQFGVTKIIGYDKNTTEQILKNTNVKNIGAYEE